VDVQRVAEVCRTYGCIADLAEIWMTMPGVGSEPRPAMMPAEMRVAKAVTSAMMATAMPAAVMPTTMATAMTTAMTTTMTTAVSALCQGRTCQHAGKRHYRNSNDRSQHLTLRSYQ
jgi:hypothetical protein